MKEWVCLKELKNRICLEKLSILTTKEFRHGQPWLRLPQILDVTLPSGVGRVQTLRKGGIFGELRTSHCEEQHTKNRIACMAQTSCCVRVDS